MYPDLPSKARISRSGYETISNQTLFSQVSRKLGWSVVPSAFQVRFAGCKGVLTLDPTLPGKTAHFRPSMRKFESDHRRLEVIQGSRAQSIFLNHQVILLMSNLGVPDEVFINLQREMLDNLAGTNADNHGQSSPTPTTLVHNPLPCTPYVRPSPTPSPCVASTTSMYSSPTPSPCVASTTSRVYSSPTPSPCVASTTSVYGSPCIVPRV